MAGDTSSPNSGSLFPATAWTLLRDVQQLPPAQYEVQRNTFLAHYWKPVFCFLRARRYSVAEAEELTQAFFERFLEKDAIRKADRQKGRFRTFMLTVLERFLSDLQNPERQSKQRLFERRWVSLSTLVTDKDRAFQPPGQAAPDSVFMKQWALALMHSIREQLKRRCAQARRPDWYEVFEVTYGGHASGPRATQESLAAQFGLTRDQVKYAQQQTRDWFAELLQGEIRQHVDSDDEVALEIRELRNWLADEPGRAWR
jgi:RNA polymerase sigma-70 factor (ECF subfamily)